MKNNTTQLKTLFTSSSLECVTEDYPPSLNASISIIRLMIRKGEYLYARPSDIIMLESCDHFVKVYVLVNNMVKKALKNVSMRDFIATLPNDYFARLSRFCAVNTLRLSGGNFDDQTLEFDFSVKVQLTKPLSLAVFGNIGS